MATTGKHMAHTKHTTAHKVGGPVCNTAVEKLG